MTKKEHIESTEFGFAFVDEDGNVTYEYNWLEQLRELMDEQKRLMDMANRPPFKPFEEAYSPELNVTQFDKTRDAIDRLLNALEGNN